MTLANWYAPNESSKHIDAIQASDTLDNDQKIIGGDFNFIFDNELDKRGVSCGHATAESASLVQSHMEKQHVINYLVFTTP